MALVVFYQMPPEDGTIEVLTKLLEDCGFKDDSNQIGVTVPVIAGHPLFEEGISEGGADRNFPKIGVEWVTDMRTEYIGQGYERFRPGENFKAKMNSYKTYLQDKRRMSQDSIIDKLTTSKLVEKFHHLVESQIVIAGFSSGGSGRKTSKWMYEAVDGCIAPLMMDLQELYPGISVKTNSHHEVNLVTDDYGTRLWGFEIPINIVQYRVTIRSVPDYLNPEIKGFDVHLVNSRTKFMGDFGLETYGQGEYKGHFKG